MLKVAAIAERIRSLESPAPSLRNRLFTHAPAHACLTYCAKGHDVTQIARRHVESKTTHRPGGTNCGDPTCCLL